MTSNLVQRHVLWSKTPYQNLVQIDHNLHNHVFDDVICNGNHIMRVWNKVGCLLFTIKFFGIFSLLQNLRVKSAFYEKHTKNSLSRRRHDRQ